MRFTDDKISHISHLIVDAIYNDDLVDFENEEKALSEVKKVIANFVGEGDKVDSFVREKVSSLKKNVPLGSREYEVLYKKYYEEEMKKRGL